MKYEKPLVAVERYVLSQSIAACGIRIGPDGTNYCVVNDADTPDDLRLITAMKGYFTDAPGACVNQPTTDADLSGICYHTSANAVFPS